MSRYDEKDDLGAVAEPMTSADKNDAAHVEKYYAGRDAATIEGHLVDAERFGQTHRGLKSRHIQFIALGGCIGTGLFVGSGATLSIVGPAPLFMAFCVMSGMSIDAS
jgi:amino acid permease